MIVKSDSPEQYIKWFNPAVALVCAVTVSLFLVAHFSIVPKTQQLFDNLQWTAGNLGAALLGWLGLRGAVIHDRTVCRWFTWGLGIYAFAQLLWDAQVLVGWTSVPAPSDLFYILLGPFTAVGFWAVAAGWVGRELFVDLFRQAVRKMRGWRDWW